MKDVKSILLVLVQFSCIGWFLYCCGPFSSSIPGIALESFAVLVGLVSIIVIKNRNLSIFPVPKPGSALIKAGPYRFIRHPMYTAVLLFCFSLLLNHPSLVNIAIWLVLLSTLLIKLRYEEVLLCKKFPEYEIYMKETRRLIPFLY